MTELCVFTTRGKKQIHMYAHNLIIENYIYKSEKFATIHSIANFEMEKRNVNKQYINNKISCGKKQFH